MEQGFRGQRVRPLRFLVGRGGPFDPQDKLPVELVVPKEGASAGSTAHRSGRQLKKDAELKFIDYMIDPSFYIDLGHRAGAPASANAAAMDQLPADDSTAISINPNISSK